MQNPGLTRFNAIIAIAAAAYRKIEVRDFIIAKFDDLFFAHSAACSSTLGTLCAKKSALFGIRRSYFDLLIDG